MPNPTRRFPVLAILLTGVALAGRLVAAETEIPLWAGDAPGSEGKTAAEVVVTSGNGERQVSSVHHPSITTFLPAGPANGLAVLVIPGGGHRILCIDHEGAFVARWLAAHGIAAFMLKH
nr:alpha/beta hydrolase [Planctomycetota bacterium]